MNVGIIGKKSMTVEAGVVIPEEKNLGSVTMNVIVTMTEAVEESGPMITEIEYQSIEAVPTEMGGILIEVDKDIGVVIWQMIGGEWGVGHVLQAGMATEDLEVQIISWNI
jgi:hypothetical protein